VPPSKKKPAPAKKPAAASAQRTIADKSKAKKSAKPSAAKPSAAKLTSGEKTNTLKKDPKKPSKNKPTPAVKPAAAGKPAKPIKLANTVKSPKKTTVADKSKSPKSSTTPSPKSTSPTKSPIAAKPAAKPAAFATAKGVSKPTKIVAAKTAAQTASESSPQKMVSQAKPVAAKLPPPPKTDTDPKIVEKIRSAHAEKELRKDLAQTPPKRTLTSITPIAAAPKGQDRIILMVRDPYWIHAHWDISRQAVERAKAALADQWHSVKPVLRLLKFEDSGTTESSENVHREIEIHGGVRNWYIDVDSPPARFQVLMGYRTGQNRFYELVRSNTVTTPSPSGKGALDDHWADIAKDAERIYAMSGGYGDETQKGELANVFEDRLSRPMDLDVLSQFGSGAEGGLRKPRQFHFEVEAELVVFGSTHPDAHVSIGSEPVKVKPDGTFSARLPFPDRRQVLPATARSRDGVDEQTVVIAVERNTKVMEPLSMEGDDL
jgi:hypothetical protein